MNVVEAFERKALFNITRAVALICVSVFLLAIVGVAFYGFSIWNNHVATQVSPGEIIAQLKPWEPAKDTPKASQGTKPPTSKDAEQSPLYGFRVPFSLQKYVSDENAQILKNHLDEVPVAERQAYIDELGAVVSAAEAAKVDVVEAINAYMKAKATRYQQAAVAETQKWETMKIVAAATASGLLLVALFSLVLVLLAIERNTRLVPSREAPKVDGAEEIA